MRQLFDLIASGQLNAPVNSQFRHYIVTSIFEIYRNMLYREEWRLDKILDVIECQNLGASNRTPVQTRQDTIDVDRC